MLFPSLDSLTFFWLSPLLFASQPIRLQLYRSSELYESPITAMCLLNYTPFEEEGPDYPFQRGRPMLAWAIPVNMNGLGASLQAIADTMPQTTTLRLAHRFRDGPLTKLPQELLEQVVSYVQDAAQDKFRPAWYQDSVCWQGTCLPEDHFGFYNDDVEKLWQEIFVNRSHGPAIRLKEGKVRTEAKKLKMVQDWMSGDGMMYDKEEWWSLHFDGQFRWIDRTCTCSEEHTTDNRKIGKFNSLQKILKTQFGLEAIILHEALSPTMHEFLPNSHDFGEYAYYTACYLALPRTTGSTSTSTGSKASRGHEMFENLGVHTAFRETLDPSSLTISEKQRSRFARTMKRLSIAPHYHLSELEPHIVHPIEDEDLMDICSCRQMDCPGECPDIHSWDRPSYLEHVIERRSKDLAKESWPKLMMLTASDTMSPSDSD